MFRIGAGGTRGEGRLRALSALGGARRRARPGSWESLGPRGIPAERRGRGGVARRGRFLASLAGLSGGSRARTSEDPALARPLKKVDGMLSSFPPASSYCGDGEEVRGKRGCFLSGGLFLSVSKSGRFFEVFLLNTCHRGLQIGKKITFLKHRKFIRTKVKFSLSTKM